MVISWVSARDISVADTWIIPPWVTFGQRCKKIFAKIFPNYSEPRIGLRRDPKDSFRKLQNHAKISNISYRYSVCVNDSP